MLSEKVTRELAYLVKDMNDNGMLDNTYDDDYNCLSPLARRTAERNRSNCFNNFIYPKMPDRTLASVDKIVEWLYDGNSHGVWISTPFDAGWDWVYAKGSRYSEAEEERISKAIKNTRKIFGLGEGPESSPTWDEINDMDIL